MFGVNPETVQSPILGPIILLIRSVVAEGVGLGEYGSCATCLLGAAGGGKSQ